VLTGPVFCCYFFRGMQWIPVTAQGTDHQSAVADFFPERDQIVGSCEQLLRVAVSNAGIIGAPDFNCIELQLFADGQKFFKTSVVIYWVKDSEFQFWLFVGFGVAIKSLPVFLFYLPCRSPKAEKPSSNFDRED
jgi:hypothetical protein